MEVIPISYSAAHAWIKERRGEIKPPAGKHFSVALVNDAGEILAAVILGKPDAPGNHFLCDGRTLEAVAAFTCENTDGAGIYHAAARAGYALGYKRIVTNTGAGDERTAEALRIAGYGKAGHDQTRERVRWIKEKEPKKK